MTLSRKVAAVEESQTLALTKMAAQLRARGVNVVSLTAGEPDFPTPMHVKEAAFAAIRDDFTHYTAVGGTPELISAIREKFERDNGLRFEPSQVLVSCGAKHSIYNALAALCNPGDEVIVPAPYWVSYPEMAKLADAVPVIVPTDASTGYKLTPGALRAALTPRSRVLVINTPSNPTGSVYTRDELEGIAGVASSAGLTVISDEIYEKILYGGARHESIGAMQGMRDRVVTVNGVSKAYAMTGWRIGYMGGPKEVIEAASKVQSQATSNPNSVAQRAAVAALSGPQEDVAGMVAEFTKRKEYFVARLREIPGVRLVAPSGAFYLFPDFSGCVGATWNNGPIKSDAEIGAYLLEEAKVAVVPGSAFGAPNHLRLSFACAMTDIVEAAARIDTALRTLLKR